MHSRNSLFAVSCFDNWVLINFFVSSLQLPGQVRLAPARITCRRWLSTVFTEKISESLATEESLVATKASAKVSRSALDQSKSTREFASALLKSQITGAEWFASDSRAWIRRRWREHCQNMLARISPTNQASGAKLCTSATVSATTSSSITLPRPERFTTESMARRKDCSSQT